MPVYEIEQNGKVYEVDAPTVEALQKLLGQTLEQRNPAEYDPSSPEFQAKYGQLGSNTQNFRAGAGKAFYDVGRGALQSGVLGPLSLAFDKPSREQIDEVKRRDAPLMSTKAGLAGNITGNLGIAAPTMFIPGVNTYTGASLVGAGLGALQPVGTGDSRLGNAALGAGGGVAGKYVGGKIGDWAARTRRELMSPERAAAIAASEAELLAQGGQAGAQAQASGSVNASLRGGGSGFGHVGEDVSAGLTQAQRDAMARGLRIGMRATPGQATGSKALQQLEAKLESQPMTSGPFNAIKENNARVVAREAAAAIGENSDELSSATLDKAFTRISGVFEDAADDVARPIDPARFLNTYSAVADDLRGVTNGFTDHELVADLVKFAQAGSATGKQLQTLTSKLGKAAYKQMTTPSGDRDLGIGLYRVKDYVDDLLQSGMGSERASRFALARTQYRNLMNLTSRVGITNPSTGNVSGVNLANLLQQKDKAGFLRGGNKTGMYDAARFAQAFKPIVGDSGTATRSMVTNPLELLMRAPFNLAARAYTSPLSVALATRASAGANAVGRTAGPLLRRSLGTAPYYAPFALPAAGGVIAPQLLEQ